MAVGKRLALRAGQRPWLTRVFGFRFIGNPVKRSRSNPGGARSVALARLEPEPSAGGRAAVLFVGYAPFRLADWPSVPRRREFVCIQDVLRRSRRRCVSAILGELQLDRAGYGIRGKQRAAFGVTLVLDVADNGVNPALSFTANRNWMTLVLCFDGWPGWPAPRRHSVPWYLGRRDNVRCTCRPRTSVLFFFLRRLSSARRGSSGGKGFFKS